MAESQRAVVRPPEKRSGKSVISGRTRSVTDVEDPLFPGSVRQRKIKGRPFFDLRFGPRASAVTVDNATNIGQADASAVEFLRLVQALEHPEQFVGVLHIEAHAVVAHAELQLPFAGPGA